LWFPRIGCNSIGSAIDGIRVETHDRAPYKKEQIEKNQKTWPQKERRAGKMAFRKV